MGSIEKAIHESTEVRRHNGQCEYGEWIPLTDSDDLPAAVVEAVTDEVVEGNDAGEVVVGGRTWVYRRS
jgi:hypothetical protein